MKNYEFFFQKVNSTHMLEPGGQCTIIHSATTRLCLASQIYRPRNEHCQLSSYIIIGER